MTPSRSVTNFGSRVSAAHSQSHFSFYSVDGLGYQIKFEWKNSSGNKAQKSLLRISIEKEARDRRRAIVSAVTVSTFSPIVIRDGISEVAEASCCLYFELWKAQNLARP